MESTSACDQGGPSVERFTVALAAGRQYLLKLQNGTTGGANRASSAVTTLNGFQVISSSDLTPSTASVTKVVSVRQIDTLRITVVGSGSNVTSTISSLKTSEFVVNGPSDYGIPAGTTRTSAACVRRPGSTTADSAKTVPAEPRLIGANTLRDIHPADAPTDTVRVQVIVASNGRVAPWTVRVTGTPDRRLIIRARGWLARARFTPVTRCRCGVPQWMGLTYAPRR
jgi:hypothetical protein